MARVKVISAFTDIKAENVTRYPGDVYECSDARANELEAKGFVDKVAEQKTKSPTARKTARKAE